MTVHKNYENSDAPSHGELQQQLSVIGSSEIPVAADTLNTVAPVLSNPAIRNNTLACESAGLSDGPPESSLPSSSSVGALDFISTGKAVKALFSIPYSERPADTSKAKPVCLAIHNFDGTLIIDQAENEENYFQKTTNDAEFSPITTSPRDTLKLLPPSCETLALAVSPMDSRMNSVALSLLSEMVKSSTESNQEVKSSQYPHHDLAPPMAPREYVEWNFQDMNWLVGSDALIVRPSVNQNGSPTPSTSASVAVRVEEINNLRSAWHSFQLKQQLFLQSQPSYAQAVLQKPKSVKADIPKIQDSDGRFSESPLQTCVISSSGPFGGRFLIESSSKLRSSADVASTVSSESSSTDMAAPPSTAPALSIVLDAYLDNLMANVPQLALCLQEKGLVQSIKFLQTEEIPSMMIHPSTLGMAATTANSIPKNKSSKGSNLAEHTMFSPQIMEMNASALLRFLKANCTRNNTTYLLRHEPCSSDDSSSNSQQHNIQLYDISSLSTQGQKKWIWWLATMSHRFALRLRHLECASTATSRMSESQRRAIRDRERSLFQQTLDLLQDLMDMDGHAHESLVASVREHLADTYLGSETASENVDEVVQSKTSSDSQQWSVPSVSPSHIVSSKVSQTSVSATAKVFRPESFDLDEKGGLRDCHEQAYGNVSVDALNKAQDHLVHGIKALSVLFEKSSQSENNLREVETTKIRRRRKRPGKLENDSDVSMQTKIVKGILSPATVMQMFGMNHKLVNVSLRLAERHLKNYYSSSAMQALRTSALRLAEAAKLVNYYKIQQSDAEEESVDTTGLNLLEKERSLLLQYVWLLEHCGHFARSFASDELWRDRGHASGDDVIYVLRDVEAALQSDCGEPVICILQSTDETDPLHKKSNGSVSLQLLSGVVATDESNQPQSGKAMNAADDILEKDKLLHREKRRVLVASCVCYSRALGAFRRLMSQVLQEEKEQLLPSHLRPNLLSLLYQRLGDACNETGKILLDSLRRFVSAGQNTKDTESQRAAEQLLRSARFWYSMGVDAFEACGDLTNLAVLRCNICQSYKLEANACLVEGSVVSKHIEWCLQNAADQLIKAHQDLVQREADPRTWDLVSQELAATFLVLGIRRRQSILGGGNSPIILASMRPSPGEERSIVDPMERALKIYEQSGNASQAGATHYQLAQTYSKLWTCQRDEINTRNKLSRAIEHYQSAFNSYATHLTGNEPDFCLLCLDLAALYGTLPGEFGVFKAVGCCLDSREAFSPKAVKAAMEKSSIAAKNEWFKIMATRAQSVEERLFDFLRGLVKMNPSKYKDLYREALSAKVVGSVPDDEELDGAQVAPLYAIHEVLVAIKMTYDNLSQGKYVSK